MKKVVINKCFGGFGLSPQAEVEYFKKKYPDKKITLKKEDVWGESYTCLIDGREPTYDECSYYDDREDPILVQVVEELGSKASGSCADLRVVEIPDDVKYEIDDYDGNESIEEIHRSWS